MIQMIQKHRTFSRLLIVNIALWCMITFIMCAAVVGCADDDNTNQSSNDTGHPTGDPLITTAERGPVSITVTSQRKDIIVGQKFDLTVEVVADEGVQVQMPIVDETLGPFVVRQRTTPPDVPENGTRRWQHKYILDTFEAGAVEIPSFEVSYTDARPATITEHGEPLTGQLSTEPLTINVTSVLSGTETDEDFYDIRGTVDVPVPASRVWIGILLAIIVSSLVSAAVAITLMWLFRRQSSLTTVPEVVRPAHKIALEELSQLEAQKLVEAGQVHKYYFRLSDIVRQYIERRFGLMAPERTTEEFLHEAGRDPRLTAAQRELLAEFLRSADMVKFARLAPQIDETHSALDRARGFVHETALRTSDIDSSQEPAQHGGAAT